MCKRLCVLAALLVPAVLLVRADDKPAATDAALTEKIEKLVKQLGDRRFRTRQEAQQELMKIGRPAVPALRTALRSRDAEVRKLAREVLEKVQSSIDYLIDELKDGKVTAIKDAADTLQRLGPKAKKAVPELVKLLKHKNEDVRDAVASALEAIDPDNKALVGTVASKARVKGNYSKLLKKIHVPQDRQSYGDYYDFGTYQATDYAGHANIPAGYWVYVYPHWYIWGESKGAQPLGAIEAAGASGKK